MVEPGYPEEGMMFRFALRVGQLALDLSLGVIFTGTVVIGVAALAVVASADLLRALIQCALKGPRVAALRHPPRPHVGQTPTDPDATRRPARRALVHARVDS
jgi:hypothetical protein